MNPKLSHLSEDQFQDLLRRYYDPEKPETVAQLISAFSLDVIPSRFHTLLPPVILSDTCPYCEDIHLQRKPRTRGGYGGQEAFCPNCGHRDVPYCACPNCRARAAEARRRQEQAQRDLVHSCYSLAEWSVPEVDDLSLHLRLWARVLFTHAVSEDLRLALPYAARQQPLSPLLRHVNDMVRALFHARVIAPDPDSSLSAFDFGEGTPETFFPDRVDWAFLPGLSGGEKLDYVRKLDLSLAQAVEHTRGDAAAHDVLRGLWLEIACLEAQDFLAKRLEEYGYHDEGAGTKTVSVLEDLVTRFSLGEVCHVIYIATRNAMDYAHRKDLGRGHALNLVPGNLEMTANKYEAEGWLKAYGRNARCPQSTLSAYFFDKILGLGEEYFSMRAVDWETDRETGVTEDGTPAGRGT